MKNLKNFSQFEKIVELTIDAVVASGKPFNKIGQEQVFSFLKNAGVSRDMSVKVYERVKQILNTEHDSSKPVKNSPEPTKTTPVKTPRKSVFSEIKKITK
jgi:hypothetical protein